MTDEQTPATPKSAPKRKSRRVGSIEQLAPTKWRVRLGYRLEKNGERREFDDIVNGPKSAAIAHLDNLRRQKASPDFQGSSDKLTLHQWCKDYFRLWAGHLRPRTRESYEQVLRLYLPDLLAAKPLARISVGAVQEWLSGLTERPKRESKARKIEREVSEQPPALLSLRTVRYCRAALRLVIEEAVRQGHVQQNVVARTRIKSESTRRRDAAANGVAIVGGIAPEDRSVRVLDDDEVARFLAAADARTARLDGDNYAGHRDRLAPYWRVALETALRPSELLGLRWSDIALDLSSDGKTQPHLSVRHSLTSAKGDGVLDEPKTSKSVRVVPISSECVRLLRQQRARQAADKLVAGGAYHDNGFVFATAAGTPIDLANLRQQIFQPLLEASGVHHARLYDLRHTAITGMLRDGVPILVVAQRAGHASAKMTLDVYGHVLPGQQDEATERIAARLNRLSAIASVS